MTLSNEQRDTLIKHRTQQAHEAIDEVELLINNKKLKLAVNRVYYGMFYILTALALKEGFQTSKHQQLIGWFNKNFIKDRKVDRKYGTILRDAFINRSESDYGVFISFKKEDVERMLSEMKEFISTVESYIKNSA